MFRQTDASLVNIIYVYKRTEKREKKHLYIFVSIKV